MTSPIAASFMRLPSTATTAGIVAAATSSAASSSTIPANKKTKDNSKAEKMERRAAQRAAAGASTTTAVTTGSTNPTSQQTTKSTTSTTSKLVDSPNLSNASSSAPTSVNPLQLFLHLDLPTTSLALSHSSKSSTSNIHPSIIRLALQYAEFKIVGANARCIAMLEAFKDVRSSLLPCHHEVLTIFE